MRSIAPLPFCDYINATVPAERFETCLSDLLEVVRAAGGYNERDGLCYVGDGGTFKYGVRYKVGFFSLSGRAVSALRDNSCSFDFWGEYLSTLGDGSHRVTRLDVALDDATDAPPIVEAFYRRARTGRYQLTRKHIPSAEVHREMAVAVVDGRDTGTVYLGARTRDVYAKVYDKRDELLCHAIEAHGMSTPELIALNDPGPLTRYELTLGRKVGVSLRDAYLPEAVFWHFAGDVLAPPSRRRPECQPWAPHEGGFSVPRSESPDYSRQLRLLLETSHDVRRAITLADRLGPYGRQYLASLLQKMAPEPPPRPVLASST